MTFRDRMKVSVSDAEIRLRKKLTEKQLTKGLKTDSMVVLRFTVPDFQWNFKKLAVYLDGEQVHKGKKLERDEEIDFMLERLGWTVLRFRYKAPISEQKLEEITSKIEEQLACLEEK